MLWHFYKLQMTIYYSGSDIAGVFYGKLIEIIINKDEKGVSIFLILHTPCGYFLRFVKKCPKDWVILHFWKAYLPAWYRTSWNFETAHRKRCCVYVAYAISFTSIVSLNSVPLKCKCLYSVPLVRLYIHVYVY